MPRSVAYRTILSPCVFRVPFHVPYRTVLATFVNRFSIFLYNRLPYRTQNLTVFRSNIFCTNSTIKNTKNYRNWLEKRDPNRLKLSIIRFLITADRTVLKN